LWLYPDARAPIAVFCTHDIVELGGAQPDEHLGGVGRLAGAPNRAAAGTHAARDAHPASA
jgi:hypothetical protein